MKSRKVAKRSGDISDRINKEWRYLQLERFEISCLALAESCAASDEAIIGTLLLLEDSTIRRSRDLRNCVKKLKSRG
jgi:hypothetical protein